MATIKQKLAFKELLNAIEKGGKDLNIKKIMERAGYSKGTLTKTKDLTESIGWQTLIAQIDDQIILARIYQILLDKDKRASLEAAEKLLKLKNRYPEQKTKIMGLFGGLK